jgi:hypothetical protein
MIPATPEPFRHAPEFPGQLPELLRHAPELLRHTPELLRHAVKPRKSVKNGQKRLSKRVDV